MTSHTLSSKKSEEKSNSSSVNTKKMRIKNVVVNPYVYYKSNSNHKFDSILFNTNNNITNLDSNPNILKFFKLIDKIENKNIKFKYFIFWKKGKK
jgi:hypothetical protein